ncbi:MAG: LemA family protein [Chloroflexi bacterium]|nr:LemA family protein [Chloroflexota bacterium]
MDAGAIFLLAILGIAALVVLAVWTMYNRLVTLRQRVREAWSGIDVQLKRRASLVPNLVETVKGYAAHEREVFENVTRARAAILSAGTPQQAAQADNMLTGALKSLFAVAEAYPQLRASENFLQMQKDLSDIESKIAYARQFYNTNVRDLNTKIQTFPSVLIARNFGFREEGYFEAEEAARGDVAVRFTA